MEESDTLITLIGTKLAKEGNEFIFKGGARECEPCRLKKNLPWSECRKQIQDNCASKRGNAGVFCP